MDRCPNCGVETRPGDQFCLNCGNRLAPAQPAQSPWGPPPGMNQPPAGQNPGWFGGPPQPQMPLPNSPTMPTIQAPLTGDANTSGATVPGTLPTLATVGVPPQAEPTFATQMAGEDPTVAAPPAPTPAAEPASPSSSFATKMAVEEGEETISTITVPPPAKLIVTRNGQAREFLLKKADISIGRAPTNEVPLSGDQLASRRHALIRYDGVSFTIRDVGSANGTYVNGVELRSPTVLRNGDHISVGEHEVVFFLGAASEEEEPTTITTLPPQAGEPQTFATSNVFGLPETPEVTPESTKASGMSGSGIAVGEPQEEEGATRLAEEPGAGGEVQMPAWMESAAQAEPGAFEAAPQEEVAPTIIGEPVEVASPAASMPPATIIERHVITDDAPMPVTETEQAQDEQMEEPKPIGAGLVTPPPPVEEDLPLPVPQLPEVTPILNAIQELDTKTAEMRDHLQKAKALEQEAQQLRDQLKAASEMIAVHDNAVAQLAQRLRVGVADVANRLKQVVDEASRAEESLSISDMMKLIEDVRNDPRDIYTVGSLARRARELGQFFELHQHINQILTGCLATLNELMAIDATKSSEG